MRATRSRTGPGALLLELDVLRRRPGHSPLREKPAPLPRSIERRPGEADPVVQPEGAVMPELDLDRRKPPAAPVGRPRNVAVAEAPGVSLGRRLERGPRFERAGLLARPGADPALPRTAREIRIGLCVGQRADRAAESRLAAQRLPVEKRRRFRTAGEFAPLGAFDIAVEGETAGVHALAQKHPHVGQPVVVDRRQRHRLGIVDLGLRRLLEPQPEERDRILGLGKVGLGRCAQDGPAWFPVNSVARPARPS